MKKKLLIILGAGSSLDQGMPSVRELDEHMRTWSSDWLCSGLGLHPDTDNYFIKLWGQAKAYYAQPVLGCQPDLNFEKLLGHMAGLAHWMTPAPMGNPLRQIVCGDRSPEGLYRLDFDSGQFANSVAVNSQIAYLLDRLAHYFRQRCREFDPGSNAFAPYRILMGELCRTFDVGVYNLNYDNLAVSALPGAYNGFDDNGQFDPRVVHERREWGFVYHLHGSVYHTLKRPSIAPIHWQWDLDSTFMYTENPVDQRSEGKSFPLSALIAGGFKLDQLLIEPFHSFYAAFARHAYEADAILIGGYGFGDAHVNWTLQNSIEDRVCRTGETRPPVMVLTKSDDGQSQMDMRQDIWAGEMKRALKSPCDFRAEMIGTSRSGGLITSYCFEKSAVASVSVWHGGFCEAASHLDQIVGFLNGCPKRP